MSDPAAPEPQQPREVVIAAGQARLVEHALDALRSQLNASQLSRDAPVSRDTAYRAFRGADHDSVTDAIITAVARATNDPQNDGAATMLQDAMGVYAAAIDDGHEPAGAWKLSMEALFETQFRSPRLPVDWLLQAAALTASSAWEGDAPTAPPDVELGQAIMATRRSLYEGITKRWQDVIVLAMSDYGRRPRPGIDDVRSIVVLIHALLDGLILRRLIEPEAVPPPLAAEALYLLTLALTEAGPHDDPRRPDDERNLELFDRLLDAAAQLWKDRPDVMVDAAADAAEVPVEAARLLFPDVGDLADSLVRARVVGGGFPELEVPLDEAHARRHLVGLVRQLRRIRDLVDDLPHAVAVSQDRRPSRSLPFADDFVDHSRQIIQALTNPPLPDRLARDLLTFASHGSPGWAAVTALLRTLGYDSD